MSDLSSNLPDVLFVTHRVPYPPDKGDRIRTYHLLRYLAARSRVHLASFADEPVSDDTVEHLSKLTAKFATVPQGSLKWLGGLRSLALGSTISEGIYRDSRMRRLLADWAGKTKFRGVILSASSLAGYLGTPSIGNAVRVVDSVDVDSQKWLDYSAASAPPKRWLYRVEGNRLRNAEARLSREADAVTLVSERESALVRQYCEPAKIVTATNGVDLDYYQPRPGGNPQGIVFVGALDYKPNVDGVRWFAAEVWPRLSERLPGIEWKIVGRRPTRAVLELGRLPGVTVVGQVPDVRPSMADSAIVIAPLMIARGLQNKVLEAMAFGKPVVGSPAALAGFGHAGELPAVAAVTPEEWVGAIAGLIEDASHREQAGTAGRTHAKTYHDWQECLAPFGRLLRLGHPHPTPGTTT